MNDKLIIENLETQMTEILKKMNGMSSIEDLTTYQSQMANTECIVDFYAYEGLVNVLGKVFRTYIKLYVKSEDKKAMRPFTETITNLLDKELTLLNDIGIRALADTGGYRQYKCIMYCYNTIVAQLLKLEAELKPLACEDCNQYSSYFCYKYNKGIDWDSETKSFYKAEGCKV